MTKQIEIKKTKAKLINAHVFPYAPWSGENPLLVWQVQATHAGMGQVQFCYETKTDADCAAKFINEFGVCPPSPMESERRQQLA